MDANRIRVRDGSSDDFIRDALGSRGARWSAPGRWPFSPRARPCAGRDGTRHTRAGSLPGRPEGIRSATSNGRPGLRHRHRADSRGRRSRMLGTGRAGAADIQGTGIGRWCRHHCIGPVVGRRGPREINLAPHRGGRLRSSNPHKRSRGCETVRHKDLISPIDPLQHVGTLYVLPAAHHKPLAACRMMKRATRLVSGSPLTLG